MLKYFRNIGNRAIEQMVGLLRLFCIQCSFLTFSSSAVSSHLNGHRVRIARDAAVEHICQLSIAFMAPR